LIANVVFTLGIKLPNLKRACLIKDVLEELLCSNLRNLANTANILDLCRSQDDRVGPGLQSS